MKILLAASALLFASSAFAAGALSLTGQWSLHQSIAGNESDQECKFVQIDDKLSGSCKGGDNKEVQITGNLDGNKVTWKYDSEYNGTPLTLTYTAALDDSGKISGNVEVEPFGVTGDFTALPSKAESQPAK
jgi:hypothetical protein